MDKDHVTGIFGLTGRSSKESRFQYLYEEFRIRKKISKIFFLLFFYF